MVELTGLAKIDVVAKKVILRMDLDVDDDYSRLETAKETLDFLVRSGAKTIIIGHKGRPSHKATDDKIELSLKSVSEKLSELISKEVKFVHDIVGKEAQEEVGRLSESNILMLENLRFDSREEKNNDNFAKSLAALGEFYVNEAFAVSHREHASVVGIPKFLPHRAGFRFIKEVENLNKIVENPQKPVVVIIAGVKKDKMEYVESLTKKADKILVGGRLPEYYEDANLDSTKILMGQLLPDKEDLTINTIEKFKDEINKAGTIIVAGVPGKYEDEGHRQATKEIFEAVAASSAFKVAGGGDTERAITMFGLNDKFDWISVGGGAMLEFLVKGNLPGIGVLLH